MTYYKTVSFDCRDLLVYLDRLVLSGVRTFKGFFFELPDPHLVFLDGLYQGAQAKSDMCSGKSFSMALALSGPVSEFSSLNLVKAMGPHFLEFSDRLTIFDFGSGDLKLLEHMGFIYKSVFCPKSDCFIQGFDNSFLGDSPVFEVLGKSLSYQMLNRRLDEGFFPEIKECSFISVSHPDVLNTYSVHRQIGDCIDNVRCIIRGDTGFVREDWRSVFAGICARRTICYTIFYTVSEMAGVEVYFYYNSYSPREDIFLV